MQSSPYNNPMMAQGLSRLVEAFTGNPNAEAQSLEAASRARLNNQTAQFRDAIGDTGMSGDLASMMIRSLQAGPDYSRHAPNIGDATIRMGALGFGGPQHTPSQGIADLMMGGGGSGRGRGRPAGSGGGGSAPRPARPMTASDMTNLRALARQSGLPFETFMAAVQDRMNSGEFPSVSDAAMDAMSNIGETPGDPVTNEPGMLQRLLGGEPTTETPMVRGIPPFQPRNQQPPAAGTSPTDEVQAMNEARFVLSQGASPRAVFERMVSLGIDPQTARTRMAEMGFDPGES